MNAYRRPTSPTLDWSGNPLLAYYGSLAADDERRRRLLAAAVGAAIALHAVIVLLVPRPERKEAPPAPPAPLVMRLAPTPRFLQTPPPVQVEAPTRRVPVPDPTPEELEPIRPFDPLPLSVELPVDSLAGLIPEAPPPAAPQVFPVGGPVLAPVRVYTPDPPYPRAAQLARREGTVVIEAIIDSEGKVTSLRALTALGFGLEQSALDTVRTWTFQPGTLHGEPVPVLYHLTVRFNLAR